MSHRTQITLTDEQYELLLARSRRSGVGLAELVRRAVDSVYGDVTVDHVIAATAQLHGAQLWTRNRTHFPMLADLVTPY